MDCGLDGLTFTQPSLCKPQFAAECDLGGIVKRFIRTGELPQFRQRPTIEDASAIPDDFFAAMQPATEVRQMFDQLPLEVRNKFNNDPEAWFADEVVKRDKQSELPLEKKPDEKKQDKPDEVPPPEDPNPPEEKSK